MSELKKTTNTLLREKQKKARLEKNLALQREQLRKADARRKIQLGGLIVKAGLENESSAFLLGLLSEAKEKLLNDKTYRKKHEMIGKYLFQKSENSNDFF